ncbi:Major facilitator superfamily domain, general substrate transporter [Beauveria brongniartii RCEF 3172]|uniref:Major facilitator superfamily domain, general substrate transporter n=1 Tax=Beauveria brongniartii RCEF 3172 TaxID=1081107 RepID=A0A166XEI0_9HYPO|nr:Major facilitator superfamily domain, general substrate transporter [Beauveria brongniartii RCEF 3172]
MQTKQLSIMRTCAPSDPGRTTAAINSGTTPSSKTPHPLFIYGTLQAKPLLAWALTGDSSQVADIAHMLKPALVSKYIRLAVKHGDYPAVVRGSKEEDCVDGYLLQVDTTSQRKKLDDFEGEIYMVESTTAKLLGVNGQPTGESVDADIYVWAGDKEMLQEKPWELERFIKERLDDWLDLFDGVEMVGEEGDEPRAFFGCFLRHHTTSVYMVTYGRQLRKQRQDLQLGPKEMENLTSVDVGKDDLVGVLSHEAATDEAAKYADVFNGETYSSREWVKLRWKLDLRLVPLLWFNITLGAMDKITTSTAVLYGFQADTGLSGDRYSWVGSAFYFGYLFWCLPSGSLLQRFPIAKLMCAVQFLWGIILIATGFANNFPTLIALRVMLGALEAPIVPGNYLLISMFYSRSEQPLRTGLMYTGLSVCFTGPIGWGIGFLSGDHQWRSMFWITGAVTVAWALVIGAFLPDSPVRAKFITDRQKGIVIDRLRVDQTGVENKKFKWEQFRETLVDPKTWLMFLFQIVISIPNGGLTNFTPLVIKGLGFTSQRSTLLTMPTGIIQTISSYMCNGGVFLCAKHFPQYQCRTAFVILGIVVGLVSSVFLYTLPLDAFHSRLAALYMSYFYLGPFILSLGLNAANTAGHTKKVVTNALAFIAYCTSNIIAPQFFKSHQAPLYPLGVAAILASYVLAMIIISLYALYCWRENRRRDAIDVAAGADGHIDTDFRDLTDKENIHFRYVW